jgi:hypothetical protein
MSKKCFICSNKNRCQIDELILSKTPYNTIAHQFKISGKNPIDTIKNHVRYGHISKTIQAAANEREIQIGLNLATCAKEIYEIATGSAKDARIAKQFGAVGSCLGPAAKVLEVLSKGDPDKPPETPKESGFMAGYMKRAGEVYAKDQSPPS